MSTIQKKPLYPMALLVLVIILTGLGRAGAVLAATPFSLPPGFTEEARGVLRPDAQCGSVAREGAVPFANPNTCYWSVFFERPLLAESNSRSLFTLDGDDALIIYGSTIEQITLYIHTLNNHSTYDPLAGRYFLTQSSLSDGFSDRHYAQQVSNPFGTKLYLIVTASSRSFAMIKRSLVRQGIPERYIQPLFFPARFANRAVRAYPDRLSFSTRYVFQTEQELLTIHNYAQRRLPALRALLVRGPDSQGNIEDGDVPTWEQRLAAGALRQTRVEYDLGLEKQLNIVEKRVSQFFTDRGFHRKITAPMIEKMRHIPADWCRQPGYGSCAYDNPLGLYSSFECLRDSPYPVIQEDFSREIQHCVLTLDNPNDFFVVIGVNHAYVGQQDLVTYSSWGLANAEQESNKAIIISQDSQDLVGSVDPFLPRINQLDSELLYAFVFSGNCRGLANCIEVPWYDASGQPRYQAAFLNGRHVLDRAGIHAPHPDNLIKARLLWFSR